MGARCGQAVAGAAGSGFDSDRQQAAMMLMAACFFHLNAKPYNQCAERDPRSAVLHGT
jgi:hypothetical protein